MSTGWGSLLSCEFRELEAVFQVLGSSSSKNLLVGEDHSFDNMNAISSGTVSTSEFTVHLGDGSAKRNVSILLVHVDDTGSSEILQHNTVILD